MIAVSIISHGHGLMVQRLVSELLNCQEIKQVIVTRNIPESLLLPEDDRILTLDNSIPKGFASNHNTAFQHCCQPFFCPLNPDIQLLDNPFSTLLEVIEKLGVAIIAPLVKDSSGVIEDSIRSFPTPYSILLKLLGFGEGGYPFKEGQGVYYPEWIAGMFLLFRSADYRRLKGFDPSFFLYYEDVDICARAWKAGMRIAVISSVAVIHDAQRTSHRDLQYLRWHLSSMLRYFYKHWGRLPSMPKR